MPSSGSGAAHSAWISRPRPAGGSTPAPRRSPLRLLADAALTLLLAPPCAACGRLLDSPTGGPVCPACWASIAPLSPPLCDRCGEPIASARAATALDAASPSGLPEALCPSCRRHPSAIAFGRSAGDYEGALKQVIHALKYEGRRGLARPLARLMRERATDALAGVDLVVPVPLHWRRRLTRGFNQAEDLARALGLPVCRVLRRRRATRAQFGLRPGERERNVSGAFGATRCPFGPWARDRRRVRGACVLLVDDVATTGATLRECAEVMRRIGAREVRTLTAARALRRHV